MKRFSKIAVAATALAWAGTATLAQDVQEVQVQATRVVTQTPAGRSPTGVPIVDLSLSYGVSLAGLNLATNSGANEAAKRVSDAAMTACKELGRQYPNSTPGDRECARRATDKAMLRVHELVAAAEKNSRHG